MPIVRVHHYRYHLFSLFGLPFSGLNIYGSENLLLHLIVCNAIFQLFAERKIIISFYVIKIYRREKHVGIKIT